MNKLSLRDRLLRFLQRNHGYFAKEDLIRIAKEHTSYSSENIGRRLRELEEDGLLDVKYPRGHAHYSAKRGHSSVVEQSPYKAPVAGSIPAVPTKTPSQTRYTPLRDDLEAAATKVRLFDKDAPMEQIFA